MKLVGTSGFEPLTPRTPSVCATRLRHVPTVRMVIIAEKLNITKGKCFIVLFFQLCDNAFELIFDLEEDFLQTFRVDGSRTFDSKFLLYLSFCSS